MIWTLLLSLPWILVGAWALVALRLPEPLGSGSGSEPGRTIEDPPLVSIIVPARNEELNVRACLESLAASRYPSFEILLVDDRSEDRTADIAASVAPGNARRLEIVQGRKLPEGWFGKPWACHQGAGQAQGGMLLFTDADTRHDPELLGRAVEALREDQADALTLVGLQIMETFWEKVILPPVFVTLALRFPDLRKPPADCSDAIANGQFIMATREAYEAVGGHEAVKGEVVEDLMLARVFCRHRRRLTVRLAEDLFATRMYRSLAGIIEGWSKNLAAGAAVAPGPLTSGAALPVIVAVLLFFWIVPPVVLGMGLLVGPGWQALGSDAPVLTAAAFATGFGVLFWGLTAHRFRISPLWGLTFPLGAVMEAYLFVRSWNRRKRVVWRGREYSSFTAMGPDG